jgi:hypothetical protein
MAVKRKNTENNTEKEEILLFDAEVIRAKDLGDKGIVLDLKLNGVTIYGCWYREYEDRKNPGDKKSFIAFPSRKGTDGNYYNYAYIKIDDHMLQEIEKQIEAKL